MPLLMTGAELKEYWADEKNWPQGSYADDLLIQVNTRIPPAGEELTRYEWRKFDGAVETLPDNSSVRIECGSKYDENNRYVEDLIYSLIRWLAARDDSMVCMTVWVPPEHAAGIQDAVTAAGGRVE